MYDREDRRFSEVIQVYLPVKINQDEQPWGAAYFPG